MLNIEDKDNADIEQIIADEFVNFFEEYFAAKVAEGEGNTLPLT